MRRTAKRKAGRLDLAVDKGTAARVVGSVRFDGPRKAPLEPSRRLISVTRLAVVFVGDRRTATCTQSDVTTVRGRRVGGGSHMLPFRECRGVFLFVRWTERSRFTISMF